MPVLLHTAVRGLPPPKIGKVREVYDLEPSTGQPELLIIATDRISAFDATMADGIEDKGAILTRMSAWWMSHLLTPKHEAERGRHHVITTDDQEVAARLPSPQPELVGRATIGRKARVLPIECVVRGALAGSLWKEYVEGGGPANGASLHGVELARGLREAELLPEPIFTPATKAVEGHDENISIVEAADRIGTEAMETLRSRSIAIFNAASARALEGRLILADTKFEFGEVDGEIILIDEALTPDSSRYWDAAAYSPGGSPASFDKQYLRDYLERIGWDKLPPGPQLPRDVREETRARYVEAFRRIVGSAFPIL